MPGIILLGLGVGGPQELSPSARDLVARADEIWVRTRQHPALGDINATIELNSFDDWLDHWDGSGNPSEVVAAKVMELGRRPEGVVYAVPGHPQVSDSTCAAVTRLAAREGLSIRTVGGTSFLDSAVSALDPMPEAQVSILDALEFARAHVPPFSPGAPALITQFHSASLLGVVKAAILAVFPPQHVVNLLHHGENGLYAVERRAADEMDSGSGTGPLTCLYVPPLDPGASIEAFQEVVAHLRAPDGCPWDREQTHQSLRRHLLEEAYEAIAAMDSGQPAAIQEELGDLLLQIVLNAQIASERGDFTLNDLSMGIRSKIIRRHPHVFGDWKVESVEGVLTNWELLKEKERGGKEGGGGLLDGVPLALPALGQAQEFQERAARVGFDWPDIHGVIDKIAEEVEEVRQASEAEAVAAELGDLFFALVNLSRWRGIDAESALRGANLRFKKRFAFIEEGARHQQRPLSELTLHEMETLWQQAKIAGL